MRAFERAVAIPDANIKDLISGAARVARAIADGRAEKPDEYASTILRRIAWPSRRNFLARSQTSVLLEQDVESLQAEYGDSSAILVRIEIRQLLETLDDRDQKIIIMRSRGFRYEEIAHELGTLAVSIGCRYHLAKNRLQKFAANRR